MEKKALGKSGIRVSPLALGGNVFGWTIDEQTSFKVLDAFVDCGLNLIDTANIYSTWVQGHAGGESESIIGNWLKTSGKREKVLIATKVAMRMADGTEGLKAGDILNQCEDSHRRLQTDCIDLYQSH
jgi:aryl-alcohol dehydrogenase-like predicted oxidoreductase